MTTPACACAAPRRVFLAVHGVESDDAVGDVQFAEQLLRSRLLIGLCFDVDMREAQADGGADRQPDRRM
jgi:hypothetical protein